MGSYVVTGASSGIGAAIVAELDQRGHDVYATVRSDAAAGKLADRSSRRVLPVIADVVDADQVAALGELVRSSVGRYGLSGLVNNAGIAVGGPVEFLPLDEWRRQFEVNVIGQVAVTQQMLEPLRVSRGRVVFIGSVASLVSSRLGGPYGASKHAIAAVSQSLRSEVAPWGIGVSLVEPGAVRTSIWEKGSAAVKRVSEMIGKEGTDLYGPAIEQLGREIDHIAATAPGPERAVKATMRALFDAAQRPRYPAGVDASLVAVGVRVLPDRAIAHVLERPLEDS